jgi:hypothetical protein
MVDYRLQHEYAKRAEQDRSRDDAEHVWQRFRHAEARAAPREHHIVRAGRCPHRKRGDDEWDERVEAF